MEHPNTMLKQAVTFRKDAEYQKAVAVYRPLWNEDPGQFGEWDGWSYAYCLFKQKEYTMALDVCRILYPRFKQFGMLRSLYARCIYHTQFKQVKLPPLPVLKKATLAIFDLSDPKDPYSVTPKAIFSLCKEMMAQPNINWQEIESWLLKMQPDLLDDQAFKMSDPSGRYREVASAMEQWYAMMLRVKAGQNRPRELLNLLAETRKKRLKWHYNNDIWFARKEAFAYKQLGENDKAEKILRQVVLQKKDWFLLFDLAELVSDEEESLQLFCRAALAKGKNEMKLKLYDAIYSKIKDRASLQQEAALHLCLIAALREEHGWGVKQELLNKIKTTGIDVGKQGSSVKIIEALIPFWKKTSGEKYVERLRGVIDHIFPNGEGGFIKANGRSFFFSAKSIKGNIKQGQRVSFECIDSFDRKKNKPSKIAIKIRAETD